jgi:hypothetical protein
MRSTSIALSLAALALALAPGLARADKPGARPAAPPAAPAVASYSQVDPESEARQADAKKLFEKGLASFEKEAWDAALADFLRSRKAWPSRAATKYAASCLRALRRFDEALELFEELGTFPNLSAADQKFADDGALEMTGKLGTLEVRGGEPGASLLVDGRFRGTLPLPAPLRVAAGPHEIGAFKEGLDPYAATVEVAPRQRATAELRSLATGGRLKVAEQRGRPLDVLVDGVSVGKTPWEGPVSVGDHLVALRGRVDLDAACAAGEDATAAAKRKKLGEVDLGTQPVSVPIKLHETTKLTLTAEELDTTLRVEPMPGGASVAIDSVVVGRGAWEGRLRVGEHKIEVIAAGFVTDVRRVRLEPRKRVVVPVELARDRDTPEWRAARNGWAGAAFGVGALGLGVFAVSGALALDKSNQLKSVCAGNVCPPEEQSTVGTARTLGTVATIGAIAGGVGVLGGVAILVAARPGQAKAEKPRAAGATLRAAVEPGRVVLGGSF